MDVTDEDMRSERQVTEVYEDVAADAFRFADGVCKHYMERNRNEII